VKHIAHLTTVHRPSSTRIFQRQCRTLARSGYRVSLIARHTQGEIIDGVEFVPIPHHRNRITRMTLGAWLAYRTACRLQADLYHFHDPELLPVGVLLKLSTRAQVVYDVHENHAQKILGRKWLPGPLRRIASLAVHLVERASARAFDGIVAVTENIASQFSHSQTIVVRNYPLLEKLAQYSEDRQDDAHNRTLIYTGGLTWHRGIYQVIQALSFVRTPQVRLTILGRSDGRRFEEEVEKLPGFRKVEYRGQVPFEETYRRMSSAAIGFVCNQPGYDYDLAQPNKLFEYMSAGVPVVASNFELWREVVEDNECGVTVDPTSPQQIAEAIDFLLGNPELRRTMGENGRRAVQEKYNWECEAEKLLSLYQELLNDAKH